MSAIRFILRLVTLLLAIIFVLPLIVIMILIFQRMQQRNSVKNAIKLWSSLLCSICGLRLKLKGHLHDNPVFIVANHVSWLDISVIHSYKLVGFVAKAEIANWPFLGWAVKSGETVFIKRGKAESRKEVLNQLEQRLNQGRSVAVFPEGRATNGEKLGRFHRQLMQASIDAEVPIQALAIKYFRADGTRNKEICFRDNERFVYNVLRVLALPSSEVEICCCEPIDSKNKSARELSHLTYDQVHQELYSHGYM